MSIAFTGTNISAIVQYLGLPATEENQTLIDNTSTTLAADAETRILAILTALGSLDTQLATARNLGAPQPYTQLKLEGSRLVRQLSAAVGIEVRTNIYE